MPNYLRSQAVADRQIRKWGGPAFLRRDGVDRDCFALEVQLSATERHTLKNPTTRVFLVSAVDLAVPPAKEDSLVLLAEDGTTKRPPLRQVTPVAPLQPRPGGPIVYYELQVE